MNALAAGRVLEVEADLILVAVQRAVRRRGDDPEVLAAGRIDLHDACAEILQHEAPERTGEELRRVDHEHTVERQRRRGLLHHPARVGPGPVRRFQGARGRREHRGESRSGRGVVAGHRQEEVVGGDGLAGGPFLTRLHRRVRHTELVEPLRPITGVTLGDALGEPRVHDDLDVRLHEPGEVAFDLRQQHDLHEVERLEQLEEERRRQRAHEHPHAVAAPVHPELGRHPGPVLVGAEGPEDPGQVDPDRRVHRVHRVQPRHRDRPHRAAGGAFDQGGGDRGGAERPLLIGDDRHHRRHRVVAGGPGLLARQPGPRPEQQLVGREVGGGATERVRRHPRVHERRVVGAQALGVESGTLELGHREIDDDDVGARRELRYDTVARRDDPLGAVRVAPQRFVLDRRARRRVDPEHARAVLAEVHRHDRAGGMDREVQHRHVAKGMLQRVRNSRWCARACWRSSSAPLPAWRGATRKATSRRRACSPSALPSPR